MNDSVLLTRSGRVATLTLNRPAARNAFSSVAQFDAFANALQSIDHDDGVSVLILTGAGSSFCAGGDVKDMQARTGFAAGTPLELRDTYRRAVQRTVKLLYDLEMPTIAAVNGPAIGLGCGIASACDIRIAADGARFAESFIRLGLIPGDGGAWFMPRLVGVSKASELLFTGDTIDAAEAERIGLVSRVVPADRLLQAAGELAGRIAAQPPRALRMTKRLIREAQRAPLDTIFELSASFQALAQRSDDHQEAVTAATEKRAGTFTGQ